MDEAGEQLVEVATAHFAATGLFATSAEAIARDAGLSDAELHRRFATKRDLFLACARRAAQRTRQAFREAAAGWDARERASVLESLGEAYASLLRDPHLLRMQLQVWAACSDPEVRSAAAHEYRETFEELERLALVDTDDLRAFVARGMLFSVAASIGLPDLAADQAWIGRLDPSLGVAPEEAP